MDMDLDRNLLGLFTILMFVEIGFGCTVTGLSHCRQTVGTR